MACTKRCTNMLADMEKEKVDDENRANIKSASMSIEKLHKELAMLDTNIESNPVYFMGDTLLEETINRAVSYQDHTRKTISQIKRFLQFPSAGLTLDADPALARQFVMNQLDRPRNPKFAGDPKKYHEWYQLFELDVFNVKNVPVIENLRRLRDSVVGEAAKAIAHLNFEPDQFKITLDIIKDSFGWPSITEEESVKEIRTISASRYLLKTDRLNNSVSL